MNITCDIAMDLIALYNDGVASEDSRLAIKEHLKSCPKCARAFAAYSAQRRKAAGFTKVGGAYVGDVSAQYKKLARHLRRDHIISTAAFVAIVAVSVAVGGYGTMKMLTSSVDTPNEDL